MSRAIRRVANRPTLIPDQIVVKFRAGVDPASASALHQQVGGTVKRAGEPLGVTVVKLARGASVADALRGYRVSPLVEYAEQDGYAYATATPNDPYYDDQWHYPAINLPTAWDTVKGSPVIVAVVDTGIRFNHPDITGITVQGWDFVSNDSNPTDPGCSTDTTEPSHGTHVSGTIAALTDNATGVAGVNWGGATGIKIMPIRVLDGCGSGSDADVAAGIDYARAHGAKIVNLSLGGIGPSTTLENAVTDAVAAGVTVVAAAGNDSADIASGPFIPANYSNVITVAATRCDNAQASYSNFGSAVDIAAPGGDFTNTCAPAGPGGDFVLSTSGSPATGNGYWWFIGTSMATPHVSGVLALLIARGFTDPAALQARLESTATDLGAAGKDTIFGSGLVNAASAVGAVTTAQQMRAFSGVQIGGIITRQSDLVAVGDNGAFTITNAEAGIKTVFAWQDYDGDGAVSTGDYYGTKTGVNVPSGGIKTGVTVTASRYSGATLGVTGASRP